MSYVPSFDSMGLRFGLCAFILVYVPLFGSIGRYLDLCAFIPFYVPSPNSMDRHPSHTLPPHSLPHKATDKPHHSFPLNHSAIACAASSSCTTPAGIEPFPLTIIS